MIKHIKGDIFESGADIILHQVNCQGVMGSGVAKQVREKYPTVYKSYKEFCDMYKPGDLLGIALPEQADESTIIVNIFAQDKFGYDGRCYTNYDALRRGLETVRDYIINKDDKIAIPYLMGCHRGGGDWTIVSKMIEEIFTDCDVTLYEYSGG